MSKRSTGVSLRNGRGINIPLNFAQLAGIDAPVKFSRPVKQKVLAQPRVMYTCLSTCFCLGFAMHFHGEAFAWRHLLAFVRTVHYLSVSVLQISSEAYVAK